MGSIFKLTALAGVAAGAYAAVKKFAPNILPDKNEAEYMAKNAINSVKLTFPTDEKYSNGTALTPPMGWSSWNTFGLNISDSLILDTAKAMATNGLKDAGYRYVNIDDGFFDGHDEKGNLKWNLKRFPKGMRGVVDGIHALGLKAGTYSDAGANTCGGSRGSGLYGHDAADCRLHFSDLGFDFIKVDYCGGCQLGLDERRRYTEISQAIRATGRPVHFNICNGHFLGTWMADVADSWRTTVDIRANWKSLKDIIAENLYLSAYARVGRYNDMDMLQVGRYAGQIRNAYTKEDTGLTLEEEATHFGMWCLLSSPLLIGCDLRNMPATTLELVTNPYLLSMNQNDLGLQAYVASKQGEAYVLVKRPSSAATAKRMCWRRTPIGSSAPRASSPSTMRRTSSGTSVSTSPPLIWAAGSRFWTWASAPTSAPSPGPSGRRSPRMARASTGWMPSGAWTVPSTRPRRPTCPTTRNCAMRARRGRRSPIRWRVPRAA